ncbi:MAG: flavoprotein [Candidatus Altiarchaeota archaeon]
MKILWCITGSGHLLEETIELMEKISKNNEITIAISNAGFEVLRMYGFYEKIKKISERIILEKDQGHSFPFIGKIANREFDKIFVMPCSANTTAKIAYGIADSLISNIVSQGLKNSLEVILLPTDFRKVERTKAPDGRKITLQIRDIDIYNVKKISKAQGIKVVKNLEEIEKIFMI